jgi:hypothetical protein
MLSFFGEQQQTQPQPLPTLESVGVGCLLDSWKLVTTARKFAYIIVGAQRGCLHCNASVRVSRYLSSERKEENSWEKIPFTFHQHEQTN